MKTKYSASIIGIRAKYVTTKGHKIIKFKSGEVVVEKMSQNKLQEI